MDKSLDRDRTRRVLGVDLSHRPCRPERYRQRRPTPQHSRVAPASDTGRPHVGEAVKERSQTDFALGTGKGGPQAEMPAPGEREMFPGSRPFDVKAVWISEHGRVPVSSGQMDDHQLATLDPPARHLDIIAGHST